jgi:hypothetical protein
LLQLQPWLPHSCNQEGARGKASTLSINQHLC